MTTTEQVKHTPGQWTAKVNDRCLAGFRGCFVYDAQHRELATVNSRPIESQDECEANARLIAASPDLLAACEELSDRDAINADDTINSRGDWATGLHCGLEDRDIVDRYEACDHGFECGVERALEWAQNIVAEAIAAATGATP